MPGPYAALRVARLDDWGQVGHQERHGKREGDPAEYEHCDPARRHLIQYGTDLDGMDPREVRACMKRQIDLAGARTRKGAAVGAHILAIAAYSTHRGHQFHAIAGSNSTHRGQAGVPTV